MKTRLLALAGVLGIITWSAAQAETIERKVKGPPGKDIRIGTYINVKADCTSGSLPTIRLIGQPEHGKVSVKKAKVNATNYKQCLALEIPGYVAFYRSAPGFTRNDNLLLEIKFHEGRTVIQKITVTVGGASASANLLPHRSA